MKALAGSLNVECDCGVVTVVIIPVDRPGEDRPSTGRCPACGEQICIAIVVGKAKAA